MPFQNPIVAGTALARRAIKSPDYVPGSTGWTINRDGSAEFTSLVVGGGPSSSIKVSFGGGSFVWILNDFMPGASNIVTGILFMPNNSDASGLNRQGAIYTICEVAYSPLQLVLISPERTTASDRASIIRMLSQGPDTVNGESIRFEAGSVFVDTSGAANGHKFQVDATTASTFNGTVTMASTLAVSNNVTIAPGGAATVGTHNLNSSLLYNEPAAHSGSGIVVGSWQAIGSGAFAPFANNFKLRDAAGVADTSYRVDAFGLVTLEGKITGGAASAIGATILTLPAGLRPHTNQFIPVLANGGAITIGQVDINTTGAMIWRGPTVVTGGLNWFALNNINFYAEQ